MLIEVQILRGLSYIHKKGLIHRDLKSANIMLGAAAEIYISTFAQTLLDDTYET